MSLQSEVDALERELEALDARVSGYAIKIERLQKLIQEAPRYFSPHDFDGDKLKWLQAAGLA